MIRAILAAFVLVASYGIAPAGVIRGVGTTSCADFGEAYKGDPKFAETVYLSLAQGFMSGLNVELDAAKKPMRDIPAPDQGQSFFIRQFCDQRPLAPFFDVVLKYFETLPKIPPHSN